MYGTSGSVSLPGVANLVKTRGTVPDLTSYLSLSDQLALEKEARSITDAEPQAKLNSAKVDLRPTNARPADARPAAVTSPVYTTKALLLAACTYNSTTHTLSLIHI